MPKGRGILPPRRFWSEFELEVMRKHYATTLTTDLAELFGCDVNRVLAKASKMGLNKTTEHISDVARARSGAEHGGAATRFKKGLVPANKGLRRPGWSPGDMARTQFKKGNKPQTWKPVGTHVVNTEGYLDRKVADGTGPRHLFWKPVHRLVWADANGPVPVGLIVVFKPGMFTNVLEEITLDRLELVTRRELLARNSIHNLPQPLKEVVHLRGRLTRAINKAIKDSHEQDENH